MPIGHAVNPNVAMVTGFSLHPDEMESRRRGEDGLRFFRYGLAHHYIFGEHKPGLAFDDKRSMLIYEACAELKLPLLFHIDNERNLDKPGLPGLENALKTHAGCNFIGHGPGWWASISGDATQRDIGGYPKTKVAPGGAIDALMDKYPNLYGDLSAGSGAGAISRDLDFGREFLVRRQNRIMFGTDYLSPGQPVLLTVWDPPDTGV